MASLRIATWNANGVPQHKLELSQFLNGKHIDVMLLSETHLTNKYNFQIPGYRFYSTNHPDGKAHGGTGILIRARIKHHPHSTYAKPYLQSTSISVQSGNGLITLAAVYCPPRFSITEDIFMEYFNTLGERFVAAGDYNAKHTYWGSRLITPKGKELYNTIIKTKRKLTYVSPGRPTYWPADPKRIPDLIDFAITKGIPSNLISAVSLPDLSSDHSPVLLNLLQQPQVNEKPYRLTSNKTNWATFKKYVCAHTGALSSLSSEEDIDNLTSVLVSTLVAAAKVSTPPDLLASTKPNKTHRDIENLVLDKRRLRREWQKHRSLSSKQKLKAATRLLTRALKLKEAEAQHSYIEQLSPSSTKHSLWKAHRHLQAPTEAATPLRDADGKWIRSDEQRACTFADHLEKVFQPNPSTNSFSLPLSPGNCAPLNPIVFTPNEIVRIIKELKPGKSPGHDLVTTTMIKHLPHCMIQSICQLFNAIAKFGYFPKQWKKSIIIMIPKPGKDKTSPASYRPISLLTCLSKLFEKVLLLRLTPYIKQGNIIPSHQFGFRQKHGTIEQVNRITSEIRTTFEHREYCSALFLDVAQAFDRVWLDGLMFKIVQMLPQNTHKLLESYLYKRIFSVRCNNSVSHDCNINAGVPQGSVLGPVLYILFTSDIPTNSQLTTHTFADDTAILSRSHSPKIATEQLARHLIRVERWFADWRIRINEAKSKHVTFTLNRETCPPLALYNTPVPQAAEVTYLGAHLDRRLTWRKHIEAKTTHMKLKAADLHWLINSNSPLRLEYKVLLYNSVLKPIWTYGSELWGSASKSNIEIVQRAQSKILRTMTGAPWYVRSANIHRDLNIKHVNDVLIEKKVKYLKKLDSHPNPLAKHLLKTRSSTRLQRNDLPAQRNSS